MNKTKNISEYGFNFQVKFIVCLITDKLFLEQIIDILDEKYLGNEAFQWIIKQIKELQFQKLFIIIQGLR